MRSTHYLPLVVLLSLTVVSNTLAQSGIRWMNNLQDAQRVAQRDGRLILMHFYTDTCGPCRKLEADVFPRTDVAAAMMKNYVPVLIDAQRSRDIAVHYRVERVPWDIITDASGQAVYRCPTPQEPIPYIRMLDGIARDHRFATPGYAVASRDARQDPARSAQPNQPLNQNNQAYQPQQPASPTGQRSHGYNGSMPPGRAPSDARRGFQTASVPNQLARESEYGPRYAGQAPTVTQPPTPTHTPSQPQTSRETYNPHVAPPNSLSPNNATAGVRGYPNESRRVPVSEYDPASQSSTPRRQSAWQDQPSEFAGRGLPRKDADAGYRPAIEQAPMPEARQPQLASTPIASRPQESPLALDGFCPVTLAEDEDWRQGDPLWGAVHRGRTYLFTSQRHQQAFMAAPDRYSPMLSGYDPVRYIDRGELVPGVRKHGMWFGDKMYLFSDEASLQRFSGSQESCQYYADRAHAIMMRAGR